MCYDGDMKTCTRCHRSKPETEFNRASRQKDGLHYTCRECIKAWMRGYYSREKVHWKKTLKTRRAKVADWVNAYKSKRGCKCGEHHPACLDFHHRDPSTKTVDISRAIYANWSIARLKTELAKCGIICANCHRKRHWGKGDGVGLRR